jgi:hypothetical protein
MALLLSLLLTLSHLDVRIFHAMIPSTIRGTARESARIMVKPHGCARIVVVLDGPQFHSSDEPAVEDKTHYFEYRDLTVGEYQVVVGCMDESDRVIQLVQAGTVKVV